MKNTIINIILVLVGVLILFGLSSLTCFVLSLVFKFDVTLGNIFRTTLGYFGIVLVKSFVKTVYKMKNQSKD